MMEASETMEESNTVYCIRCGKKTEYSVKLQRVRVNVCGVRFSYIEKAPCCTNCGESVYISEVEDQNVDARTFEFNKAREIKVLHPELMCEYCRKPGYSGAVCIFESCVEPWKTCKYRYTAGKY